MQAILCRPKPSFLPCGINIIDLILFEAILATLFVLIFCCCDDEYYYFGGGNQVYLSEGGLHMRCLQAAGHCSSWV